MENRRCAIVTGGSRGIGRAICARLAKDGINVIFNYNSNEEEANNTIKLSSPLLTSFIPLQFT